MRAILDIAPLMPEHAFVVQLIPELPAEPTGELRGRVEHVVSGESAYFNTRAELSRFMSALIEARSIE